MSNATRERRLREKLIARFAPVQLLIEDESHLHAGHAGASGGSAITGYASWPTYSAACPRLPGTAWCTRRWMTC